MANSPPLNIPKPPDSANLNELHRWSLAIYQFLVTNFGNGLQSNHFSSSQISAMNELQQAGKLIYEHDTGKLKFGSVSGNVLTVKEIATV